MNDGRRERQQEHVAVAEVPLAREQLLADPRADERGGDRPDDAQPDDDDDRRFMPMRKSSCLPSLASPASFGSSAACTAWNSSSGIRATNRPVMKCDARSCSCSWSREVDAEHARVREQLREHRADEQPGERARQLRVRRVGSGQHQVVLAAQRDRDREDRRRREREAVRDRPSFTPTAKSTMHATMRTVPSEPCMRPYGPKRPLPESVPRVMYAT